MSRIALPLSLALFACTPTESPQAKKDETKPDVAKKDDAKLDVVKNADSTRLCTEKGCFDTGTIETKLSSAGAPLGKHEFALEVDGKAQSCSVEFTDITQLAFGECSEPQLSLIFGPVTKIEEVKGDGVVSASAVPVPGEFYWQLSLPGTPTKVHVVHTHAGKPILDQSAELTHYEEWLPNGEGCGPVCKSARVEWKGP